VTSSPSEMGLNARISPEKHGKKRKTAAPVIDVRKRLENCRVKDIVTRHNWDQERIENAAGCLGNIEFASACGGHKSAWHRSLATNSPRGTAGATTQPLTLPPDVRDAQPNSPRSFSIDWNSVFGQLSWTWRGKIQEVRPRWSMRGYAP
jgi:hypothetical protein